MSAFVGCSSIKLGYNNGQHLAYWWINDYLSLTDAQAQPVRESLKRLHQWHSTQELPRYAALLKQMRDAAASDVSAQQVCGVWSQTAQRVDAMLVAAAPDVVHLANTLQPAQLHTMERRNSKSNTEFRNEWSGLSPAAILDKRFEKALERTEKIYGPLDASQQALLKTQLAQSSVEPQQMEADRVRRQQVLLQLLKQWKTSTPAPSEAALALRGTLTNWLRVDDAGKVPPVVVQWCGHVAALHNQTTPVQRRHAQDWLRGYEEQFVKLAQPH
ncbi:DUF6279 family lipoprotein [Variovorax sp. HJSM1_2]|uniref:DUF6279 family lipoprotein n=1 Tax=Variovorax sp. HJSM1_2 TaxID=3366263 RepID=UPI003BE55D60